jgi:hypothetical protein
MFRKGLLGPYLRPSCMLGRYYLRRLSNSMFAKFEAFMKMRNIFYRFFPRPCLGCWFLKFPLNQYTKIGVKTFSRADFSKSNNLTPELNLCCYRAVIRGGLSGGSRLKKIF